MENYMAHFLSFCVAFIPSVVGAISGIGGGVIIKPVLDAVFSLKADTISFLSGCTVLAMSSVSLLRNQKTGVKLEGKRGTALAVGSVLGGLVGKQLFTTAIVGLGNSYRLQAIQTAILIVLVGWILLYSLRKDFIIRKNIQNLPFCAFLGLMLGMVSAFLGIGGGPANIVLISYFLFMDTKTSAVHSLYTIFLSQLASLILTIASRQIPPVEPFTLVTMVAGGIMGGLLGSRLIRKLRNSQIDILFWLILELVIFISTFNRVKGVFLLGT
jgi:uncharacterized membrane protein YfcA